MASVQRYKDRVEYIEGCFQFSTWGNSVDLSEVIEKTYSGKKLIKQNIRNMWTVGSLKLCVGLNVSQIIERFVLMCGEKQALISHWYLWL